MAYRPFAFDYLSTQETLIKSALAHHKTWRQIVLRWLIQHNIQVISKASSKEHLLENISIFDFSLTDKELADIAEIKQSIRTCKNEFIDFSDIETQKTPLK
jgi:diketogulonate reductase-like aldo/keto reductase